MAISPGGRPMDTAPFSASTTSNWVARAGGLPDYVRGVAHALLRKGRAKDEAQAIGMAIGLMQDWAAGRTPDGKGRVHPQVQAAAAAALAKWTAMKASAHSHANETGGAVSLTWNGQAVDLASVDLAGYLPPHVPAGSPKGGQFGTTSGKGGNSGGTAGKTPAQQHALHMAHIAHLQHLVDTGKATPAQKAELAGLLKALGAAKGAPGVPGVPGNSQLPALAAAARAAAKAQATGKAAAKAQARSRATARAKARAAAKAKALKAAKAPAMPSRPVVNRKAGTVTTVIGGKRVTMTLHQWHARHAAHLRHLAHLKAAGHANDAGRFLDLAVADALAVPGPEERRRAAPPAGRVPPGVPEGGQYAPRPPQFTRHDTPARAADVINSMGPEQRARVRATVMCPPGYRWGPNDTLAVAQPG
jgi:hypothetical protein